MTHALDGELAALATRLRASTVRVYDERRSGSGSGIVWGAEGTVMTNAHVVRGTRARLEWEDGRSAHAEVVKRDDERDLAALCFEPSAGLVPVAVRSSSELAPGELVVAVGNPLGLTGALTAGMVQRCNARWVVADVRLAPGNSGGPLADGAGRVVGINSMVAGGLALAVPSDAVVAFLHGLRGRRARHGFANVA
jgi:serine protease Do